MIRSRTSLEDEVKELRAELAELKTNAGEVCKHADMLNRWIHSMSYNDSYFGEPPGYLKSTVRQLQFAVNKL